MGTTWPPLGMATLFAEPISALKTAFGRCLSTVLSEGCNDDDLAQ